MALYLGSNLVSPSMAIERFYKTGTVISDEYGSVILPKVNFEPKLIAVWNISEVDQWEDSEAENPEETYDVRYLYDGIMLFSVKQNGTWFSQYTRGNSGDLRIQSGSAVEIVEDIPAIQEHEPGIYVYHLCGSSFDDQHEWQNDTIYDIANVEFNYAIYG